MPELSEKCGVFGVVTASQDAARLTYYGLAAAFRAAAKAKTPEQTIAEAAKKMVEADAENVTPKPETNPAPETPKPKET